MNLKYSILWFEDSDDLVASLIDTIKDHVEGLGFGLVHEVRKDDSEFKETIKRVDPDLVLVDYDLGKGTKGDTLVDRMRQTDIYAEVVFYSEKYADFFKRISGKLEGVYYSDRTNLSNKICSIIDRTVKKQQDINNMRGLIIAETIDLERKMDTVIAKCLSTDEERRNVVEKILDPEFDILSLKKKYDLINKICKERIKTLERLCGEATAEAKEGIQAKKTEVETKKAEFVNVYKEIIEVRNVMAHTEENPKIKNTLISYIRKEEPITVDDNFCRETRKNLRKHSENLNALISNM